MIKNISIDWTTYKLIITTNNEITSAPKSHESFLKQIKAMNIDKASVLFIIAAPCKVASVNEIEVFVFFDAKIKHEITSLAFDANGVTTNEI